MNETTGWQRGFWALWVTQFQGAFSDNVFKFFLIFLALGQGLWHGQKETYLALTGVLFALPFVLFAMTGGWLADRFSKRSVTIGTKVMEVAVMGAATAAFALQHLPLMLFCLFLMATQSALFSPSKYGLLPEMLPESRLSWANGFFEMGTFMAIIAGTAAASGLFYLCKTTPVWAGATLVGLALAGLAASQGITHVPAAAPQRRFQVNPLGDLWTQLKLIRRDRVLLLALVGNTYFWFLGAMLQLNIVLYGTEVLRLSEEKTALMQVAVALGIGAGSLAAGFLSGRKIEYGLVPLGALGITVFSTVMFLGQLTVWGACAALAGLGWFGGFFAVPVNALLQHRPDSDRKGAVLAAAGMLSSIGVLAAAGVYYLLTQALRFDPRAVFGAASVLTLVGAGYTVRLVPDSLLRLLVWMLTHSIYRIKVEGRENIPEKGGALFVCNHVSFVDALLLIGSTDRMLRAIMFKDIYELWFVKPFARAMRAIPISSQLRPREMIRSLREAGDAIRNGEVVVIFAEGQITRIGQLLPFRRGFERIMKDVDAPIIPVCLDNVWGSIFSFEKRRFVWKVPRYIPYPVTVSYGKPMPPTSTPFEVRQAVQDLNANAWQYRRKLLWPLHRAFVRKAQHHRWRFFMADASKPRLNFGAALTNIVFLARRLRAPWRGQPMVGILLPPCVPAALVNYAALLLGKVPVNLNYTANADVLARCVRQCNLQSILTSRAFVERLKLTLPVHAIYLEEIAARPLSSEKAIALAISWLLPPRWMERLLAGKTATLDDLATIIFSSGSTGDPKGVMLTHWNIRSNIEQMGQAFAFHRRDRIVGILPFFHSFGFTGTLMAPGVLGCGVVFHPSPLDARAIGALVRKYRCTFLLATPTFLQLYLRSCEAEDFGSLQYVVTGAEKLPERLAQAFEDKFGIRPLEGYGCTECSPVVAVNTRDFRAAGFRQVGAKRGKIGHPLPGIAVRVVDPDTRQPVPVGQPGLLLVRGPNVMLGYLGKPEKTAEVLQDGWYVTGDVASLDEDGFLTITDRLTRFSKIGGEMVPHIKIEEKLHELADTTEPCFAVTGVPDEKKGERLVVLHTLSDDKLAAVLEKLAASDLPNLWKPKPDHFFRIESLPYLGTGKLDLRKIKEMAAGRVS